MEEKGFRNDRWPIGWRKGAAGSRRLPPLYLIKYIVSENSAL